MNKLKRKNIISFKLLNKRYNSMYNSVDGDFCNAYNFVNSYPFKVIFSHIEDFNFKKSTSLFQVEISK